jgi:nicotinate-nucleotide adenylyltransferase
MKVAFFGGSFDPPHRGHIALARLAIDRLNLDRVLIAPVGAQPLKRNGLAAAPFEDRVAMVRLAVAGEPHLELSLVDAPRPGGRPNYTIDTLKNLLTTLNPDDQLYCLMGADSFLTLGKWHRAEELLLLCDFIVGSRPGFELQKIAAALPPGLSLIAEDNCAPGCLTVGLQTMNAGSGPLLHSRIYLLTDLDQDISATGIRLDLQAGAEAQLNPAVAAYISQHRLYHASGSKA